MTKIELEKQNRALRDRLVLKEHDLQEANARIAALKYRIEELKENPIRALQAAVHANAVSKGWYENPPTFAELLMLVVSEASEALEDYRNGLPITENHYKDGGKPCGIPSELADIVIRVLDMCGYYGIDLAAAIQEKHEYNKTRQYRHGGKKL